VLNGIDVDKLDWSQLNIDATTLNELIAAKKRAHAAASGEPNWSNDRRANGTSAVTVKQSMSLLWDTQVGADMTVAREPTTMSELLAEKALNGGSVPQSSGSAWTTATAPGAGSIWNKTAVEARVDPGAESSKLGASLSKIGTAVGRSFADAPERLQRQSAGHIHPQLRDRPIRQGHLRRDRHRHRRWPDHVDIRRQMTAQARCRAEAVRQRHRLRLRRRDLARRDQQEPVGGLQEELVAQRAMRMAFTLC